MMGTDRGSPNVFIFSHPTMTLPPAEEIALGSPRPLHIHNPAGESPRLIYIESRQRGNARPYHRQKLAFLLSNHRHRALESQSEGHPVLYLFSDDDYGTVLAETARRGRSMCFDHRTGNREQLKPAIADGLLLEHEHVGG